MNMGNYSDKIIRLRNERRRIIDDIRCTTSEKLRKKLYGALTALDQIITRYEKKHSEFVLFRRYSVAATKRDGNLSKFLAWYESNGFSCLVKNNSTRYSDE